MAPPNAGRVPPGPKPPPVIGFLPQLQRDPLGFFTSAMMKYGDFVRVGKGWYLISHPDLIKHVLQDNNRNYVKGAAVEPLKLLVGNGLLTSEGTFWLRQRRLAQPAFHHRRIASMADTMVQLTGETLDRWQHEYGRGQRFDVATEMMALTARIIGVTMFGTDVAGRTGELYAALSTSIHFVNQRSFSLLRLPPSVPTPKNRQFTKALASIDGLMLGIIADHRRSNKDNGDLISMLMQATDADTGEKMSDQQLLDEAKTVFLAGHETTANLLAWAFVLLSRHPAEARRLSAELRDVLGERTPTFEDVPKLRYTRMVVDETLRLYPPAWSTVRMPLSDDVIGGYRVAAGAFITISPYVTHRHPAFWINPEGFDPERFNPELPEDRPRFAYFPFGGGPRICIGSSFALMEATLLLAMIAQRFQLDLVSGHPIAPMPQVTLRPKHGVLVTLRPT
ncbi:MAG: cytochrome P450 [Roseiflexaceae bacterium]|nr:cytochrome P450 [Roseiflexaceae bacterium]